MTGVGTNFAIIARRLGYPDCASCSALAATMDRNGPAWCAENREDILDELEERAKSRGWIFSRVGAGLALSWAMRGVPEAPIESPELLAWQAELHVPPTAAMDDAGRTARAIAIRDAHRKRRIT